MKDLDLISIPTYTFVLQNNNKVPEAYSKASPQTWIRNLKTFRPQVPLILRWDWKVMENCCLPGQEIVHHIPVLVFGQDVKFLAVSKLHGGTVAVIATLILQTLDEWNCRIE